MRYADDFVMGFQKGQDARAMRKALAERLAKFGLELHPDKTRVLRFGRGMPGGLRPRWAQDPETCELPLRLFGAQVRSGRTSRARSSSSPHVREEDAGSFATSSLRDPLK